MRSDENRAVRVFISSTFVDMQGEREELVRQTFPGLRARFRARGVEVFEIDLRWGVRREDVEKGNTLPICLAEIERCKPYFIGLLGERYGTVLADDEITSELRDAFPILRQSVGRSLTEMEIAYGVLDNPDAVSRAFFFERDAGWLDNLSDEERALYVTASDDDRAKLANLKALIRASGVPIIPYWSPKDIGPAVEGVLSAAIQEQFPEAEPPDASTQAQRLHAAFARERRRLYVGAENRLAVLQDWMSKPGPNQVFVVGAPGCGKSALVANFVHRHRQSAPEDFIFEHYIGASRDSTDTVQMVRRLQGELKCFVGDDNTAEGDPQVLSVKAEWFRLQREVRYYDQDPRVSGNEPSLLRGELRFCLALANAHAERIGTRILIAVDGLDKLPEPLFEVGGLWWIMRSFPPRVKFLVSGVATPTKRLSMMGDDLVGILGTLASSDFDVVKIAALGKEEQRLLLTTALREWGKELSTNRARRILAHRLAATPMFLWLIIQELRFSGVEGHLDERLNFYLRAGDMPGLFDKILERLEGDCGARAVRDAVSAIWASRAGVEEAAIITIAGLSPLSWATLRFALEPALGDQLGRITLSDSFLRQAVVKRYLPTEQDQRAAHVALADHYSSQPLSERKMEELPYQLHAAEAWQILSTTLSDPDLFVQCIARSYSDVERYRSDLRLHGYDVLGGLSTALLARYAAAPTEAEFLLSEIGGFFNAESPQLGMWFQDYLWHRMKSGDSGGPLVDANGRVIGIRLPRESPLPVFAPSKETDTRAGTADKFQAGSNWFLFVPGGRFIQIRCPQCNWEDTWDRGEERAPEKCPECGFDTKPVSSP